MAKDKKQEEWEKATKMQAHPLLMELAEKTKQMLDLESQLLKRFRKDVEYLKQNEELVKGKNNG